MIVPEPIFIIVSESRHMWEAKKLHSILRFCNRFATRKDSRVRASKSMKVEMHQQDAGEAAAADAGSDARAGAAEGE